jgi:hypothetical protein
MILIGVIGCYRMRWDSERKELDWKKTSGRPSATGWRDKSREPGLPQGEPSPGLIRPVPDSGLSSPQPPRRLLGYFRTRVGEDGTARMEFVDPVDPERRRELSDALLGEDNGSLLRNAIGSIGSLFKRSVLEGRSDPGLGQLLLEVAQHHPNLTVRWMPFQWVKTLDDRAEWLYDALVLNYSADPEASIKTSLVDALCQLPESRIQCLNRGQESLIEELATRDIQSRLLSTLERRIGKASRTLEAMAASDTDPEVRTLASSARLGLRP